MKLQLKLYIMFILVAVLMTSAYIFVIKRPVKVKESNVLSNSKISVISSANDNLKTSSSASDNQPDGSSDLPQSPGSAASNLQSNVNINDPNLANNSYVQSLKNNGE